jgi:hypothetical protein
MRMPLSKHHVADGRGLWPVDAIVALSTATDTCGFQRFAPALGLPVWAGALSVIPIKRVT